MITYFPFPPETLGLRMKTRPIDYKTLAKERNLSESAFLAIDRIELRLDWKCRILPFVIQYCEGCAPIKRAIEEYYTARREYREKERQKIFSRLGNAFNALTRIIRQEGE